jgi:hypothetical protein
LALTFVLHLALKLSQKRRLNDSQKFAFAHSCVGEDVLAFVAKAHDSVARRSVSDECEPYIVKWRIAESLCQVCGRQLEQFVERQGFDIAL